MPRGLRLRNMAPSGFPAVLALGQQQRQPFQEVCVLAKALFMVMRHKAAFLGLRDSCPRISTATARGAAS